MVQVLQEAFDDGSNRYSPETDCYRPIIHCGVGGVLSLATQGDHPHRTAHARRFRLLAEKYASHTQLRFLHGGSTASIDDEHALSGLGLRLVIV